MTAAARIMRGFPPPPEMRPTLENWDLPPFNRWSFQNVRRVLPTAPVSRGAGPVDALPSAAQDFSDIAFTAIDGATRSVAQMLADTYTDGFMVVHRGRIVTELYFNGMTPSTEHLSQSVAKSIVSTIAGILIHDGVLDPRAPLSRYVPELAACGYGDAKLDHVLDMRSGVRFDETYGDPDADISRFDIASGWRPPRAGLPSSVYDLILTLPKAREHGGVFQYRSVETDVIGWVMERATDRHLCDLVSRHLWSRIGAGQDAYFTVDRAGTALADGGFNATLRDYARFGLLHLNDGLAMGQRVVPSAWVRACRTGDPTVFGEPYNILTPGGAYSNQWWVRDPERGITQARGVFGQLIWIDPPAEMVAVKLSSWPNYLMPEFSYDTYRALEAIARELGAR
jgi:CubicO group peptidase (beta-lactamase class C family)